MKGFICSLLKFTLLCGMIGSCIAASAQCSFKTLTIPGSGGDSAIGVNDQGAIVGAFLNNGNHGYLLSQGKLTTFRFPGSFSTEASGINNHSQIVGDYANNTGQHGFIVLNGVFHSISAPGAPSQTRALGINNFGAIVGDDGANGFLLSSGHFTNVRFPGSRSSMAFGINDFGTIVGTYGDSTGINHGFMLKSGKYTSINFPGADNTSVFRIDNEGDIVGIYEMHGDVHGFTLDKGRFTTHDDPNAGSSTIIFGVNSHDRIVGSFIDVGGQNHSFTATCSGVF
jgi:hypothetical protein